MRILYYGVRDLATPKPGAKDLRTWYPEWVSKDELEVYLEDAGSRVCLPGVRISFGGDGWHQPGWSTHLLYNGQVWVALEEEREIPDHTRDDEYTVYGPFELNEDYGTLIRNVFGIPPSQLTAAATLRTAPDELERIALRSQRPSQEKELAAVYRGEHLHFMVHHTGWEFVRRSRASQGVTIVAATKQNKIVLVEQVRVPLGKTVIELPAGLVGDTPLSESDDLTAAVRRELEEETGYTCQDVEVICTGSLLPGLTDEINSLCWAKGLAGPGIQNHKTDDEIYQHEKPRGIKKEGERIQVYEVPMTRVEEWLQEQIAVGKIVDLKVYLGLFFLRTALVL